MQEAVILAGMARCHMAVEWYTSAEKELATALTKMRAAGNRAGESGVIANLGELQFWQAINFFGQSIVEKEKAGRTFLEVVATSSTGSPGQHFTKALEYYNQALPLMREVGDRNGEIGVLTNIGLVYEGWHKPSQALDYYLQALEKMDALQVSA